MLIDEEFDKEIAGRCMFALYTKTVFVDQADMRSSGHRLGTVLRNARCRVW